MLVLSRKSNERILIGGEIEVTVVEVKKNRVKLGFRCPADIPIRRQELLDHQWAGLSASYQDVKTA